MNRNTNQFQTGINSKNILNNASQKFSLPIEKQFLGLVPFEEAFSMQMHLSQNCINGDQIYLMGLEHPIVVTAGKSISRSSDIETVNLNSNLFTLNTSEADDSTGLISQNIFTNQIVQTDRGGKLTIHSPGQLVIYPIFNIHRYGLSVKEYVCLLLNCISNCLAEFNVSSKLKLDSTGVYTDSGKIAFCGLRVSQGVVRHGISINISNDLSLFDNIVPCGLSQCKMDKLGNYQSVSTREFFDLFSEYFIKQVKRNIN